MTLGKAALFREIVPRTVESISNLRAVCLGQSQQLGGALQSLLTEGLSSTSMLPAAGEIVLPQTATDAKICRVQHPEGRSVVCAHSAVPGMDSRGLCVLTRLINFYDLYIPGIKNKNLGIKIVDDLVLRNNPSLAQSVLQPH